MKLPAILFSVVFLVSCNKQTHKDQDDLKTKWSEDGKIMIIERKGVQIAAIRNGSNACFIEISGGDSVPDVSASYFEDTNSLESAPENIVLSWKETNGLMKIIAYDQNGNIETSEKFLTE